MKLASGDRVPWPSESFYIKQSELVVATSGLALFRIPKTLNLPGLPIETVKRLGLELVATQESFIVNPENIDLSKGSTWLRRELLHQCSCLTGSERDIADQTMGDLFEELYRERLQKEKNRIQSHSPLNLQAEISLFLALEQAQQQSTQTMQAERSHIGIIRCIESIHHDGTIETCSINNWPSEPRQVLQLLLDHNDLIGRDVLVTEASMENDCGSLIAFFEENESAPVALTPTSDGYQLWAPLSMEKPCPAKDCRELLSRLSPRMVAISSALRRNDLSTLGLLRFAFGRTKHFNQYLIGGLLVGLSAGFLFSIGHEVGAIRWIFSLGISGTVLGAVLGFVSGGFRSGIAFMTIATGLAMLTPTFNTVITNNALPDRDLGLLLQISLIMVVAGVTRVALEWIQSRDVLLTQHQGAARIQLAAMYRMLSLPIEFFRLRSIGELQLRFGAFEELRLEIQALTEGGLIRFLLTSIYVLFMLKISVKLTLLAVSISLLIALPITILALRSRKLQRHQEVAESEAQSRNLELINSVSKLRIAGAETAAARWWGERYKQVIDLESSIDKKESTASLVKSIMPNLGTLMIYIMITKLISEAAASNLITAPNIGQQLGFFAAFNTFIGGIAGLAGLFAGAFDLPVIYERARPLLDAEPEAKENTTEIETLIGQVQLDRVSYRYDDDRPLVLDSVSFEAKAGEYVAIVGPSGSGKSTLVRLLLGFAEPENGIIRFDGRPLSGLALNSVRRQIGTVLQSNSLLSASMMEAIAGGAVIEEDEAWHAAELAGLADDIRAMPMGMHTLIPDGGGTLSGGQRQRVAIARALVHKPRLLIFDEATSALDNHSQAVITRSLDQLSITRMVIAHRLSTIRNADRIIVMNQGQVSEQGNYDQLITDKGLFYRLMQRQIQ